MKVYRYMSDREFYDLWNGIPLVSDCRTTRKSVTDSEGFCFLPEKVEFTNSYGDKVTFSPEDCIRFLSGIVTKDVLVEMDVLCPEILYKGYGVYADPTTDWWYDRITIAEYSTPEYSRDELEPIRYCVGGTWYEC